MLECRSYTSNIKNSVGIYSSKGDLHRSSLARFAFYSLQKFLHEKSYNPIIRYPVKLGENVFLWV